MLVTGSKSGLGKYLCEEFKVIGIDRQTDVGKFPKSSVGTIIHCAFSRQSAFTKSFFDDNILLTRKLLEIPHDKFIYISSVDVYPSDELHLLGGWEEIDEIGFDKRYKPRDNLYAVTKLLNEQLISTTSQNFLILRCSGLLGKTGKPNTITKLLNGGQLTVTKDSLFNYIGHQDVMRFIRLAIEKDLTGAWNLCSSESLTTEEIADTLSVSDVRYGDFKYDVGMIDTSKAIVIGANLRSTKEVIQEFAERRNREKDISHRSDRVNRK